METSESSLYWAVPGFQKELKTEFEEKCTDRHKILADWGHVLWIEGPALDMGWSQASWHGIAQLEVPSIGAASKFLSTQADRWTAGSLQNHRRAQLILDHLKSFPKHWRNFRENLNHETWGGFCLLDEKHLLVSKNISPKLPLEGPSWLEDKQAPSRAYLKLWEVFYRLGKFPGKNERCFELGASPGGWTWVLRGLEARVWATDRADLAPFLMNDPLVHFQKGDGFQIKRDSLPEIDWVFSDVIAYPEKLWDWAQMWLEAPNTPNMICTIKFQGETDFKTLAKFAAVPNSQVMHLYANKHELTWVRLRDS